MKKNTVYFGIQMDRLVILAGIFCLSLAMDALAVEKKGPCAEDVAKLCKDVEPGGGRIAQCIKNHTNELSPECKKGIEDGAKYSKIETTPGFWPACKDDAIEHCKGIKPGSGDLSNCLKQFENDIDSECRDLLK
jgi:hypothetical protein